jgi:hypothetical protein
MADYQGEKFKSFLIKNKIRKVDAAKKLGIVRSALYDYFGSKNMSRETVQKILDTFNVKEDNIWGDLESPDNDQKVVAVDTKISNAKSLGTIEYPLESETSPFIDLGNGKYIMIVPLVTEYAYAGYLSGFRDPEYLEELPKHTIIVDKHHKGNYRAFEGVGDSMDDGTKESIPDGSIVTAREINQDYWKSRFHTHRYKDYVIVTNDEGIIIKRIINHDVENGIITCHSLNPDKSYYPDFNINLRDVKQIFNIVNVSILR